MNPIWNIRTAGQPFTLIVALAAQPRSFYLSTKSILRSEFMKCWVNTLLVGRSDVVFSVPAPRPGSNQRGRRPFRLNL